MWLTQTESPHLRLWWGESDSRFASQQTPLADTVPFLTPRAFATPSRSLCPLHTRLYGTDIRRVHISSTTISFMIRLSWASDGLFLIGIYGVMHFISNFVQCDQVHLGAKELELKIDTWMALLWEIYIGVLWTENCMGKVWEAWQYPRESQLGRAKYCYQGAGYTSPMII